MMWRSASLVVGVTLVLSALGVVMLASTSSVQALQLHGQPHYFVVRQAVFLAVAMCAGFVCTRIDYRWWQTFAIPLAAVSLVLLALALVPGIGIRAGGSYRWIGLGPVNFQPSELAKLSSVTLMAWYMARSQRQAHELWSGLLLPLLLLGSIVGLIFAAPDFGTTLLVALVGLLILFAGGSRIGHLTIAGFIGGVAFLLAVMHSPLRMRRVFAFLDPHEYAQDEAFQLLSAMYAFVIGGAGGVGLGQSIQKRFYLPEAHTDFIFAIVGEELGLAASLFVVACFAALFVAGMRIAQHAPDLFGKLLALGITLMVTLQAALNMAVVTGLVPTKGLPLPLISYGGSSLVMTMVMVGILVSIGLNAGTEEA